jgi:hypothetical protein
MFRAAFRGVSVAFRPEGLSPRNNPTSRECVSLHLCAGVRWRYFAGEYIPRIWRPFRRVPKVKCKAGAQRWRKIRDAILRTFSHWASGIPSKVEAATKVSRAAKSRSLSWSFAVRSGSASPRRAAIGVRRRSALSWRRTSRCSARLVNIRYGSGVPFVTKSSIRPQYRRRCVRAPAARSRAP